tara:strand:+ start:436 stop:1521 length:1086 start_codon:yes stop_codon:yes gene_type:complete
MTKVIIKAADGTGAVEAYHNANKKLETTATGTTVTGNIAVTGTVDGRDIATDGAKLDGIAAGANVGAALTGSTDNTVVTVTGANAMQGESNVRIDSSSRMLLGHTASVNAWGLGRKIQVHGTDGSTASIAATRWSNDANPSSLILAKSRSGTPGSFTTVADDDYIGTIGFLGDDGTDLGESVSRIDCRVDGTVGGNQLPGRLEFSTTKSNGQSTVKMTIDSSGYVTKPNTPCFHYRTYNNSSTNASMNSDENVILATAVTNIGNHYDTSNGRFTCPVDGRYLFFFNATIDNNLAAGYFSGRVDVNGSGQVWLFYDRHPGSVYSHSSGSCILSLSANDYVQFWTRAGLHNGSETNGGGYLIG